MSKNVKIVTNKSHRAGGKITLPEGLGIVQFDENCQAEIDDEIAERIVAMNIGIDYVDEEIPEDNSFTPESLSKLTVKDLKEICVNAGIAEDEFKKITQKAPLIELILNKLKASVDSPVETEEEKATREAAELANKGTGTQE